MTERAQCPECDGTITITADGFLRVHGPKTARCPGSGNLAFTPDPVPAISELTILGTLERAVQSKPQGCTRSQPPVTPGYDPSCTYCDHDAHRCGGCGEPLGHDTPICTECRDEIAIHGESGFQPEVFGVPIGIEPVGPLPAPPTPNITAERLASAEARQAHAEAQVAERRRPVKPAWTGAQRLDSLGADAVLGAVECFQAIVDMLRRADGRLSCDIETEGLGLAARHIKAVIFSDEPDGSVAAVLDPRDTKQREIVLWTLDHAHTLAFHNSAYDVPQLAINGLFTVEHCAKVEDTLLWARLAEPDETTSKNLGSCAQRYLGLTYDKKGMLTAGKTVGMTSTAQVYEQMDLDRPIYARGAASDAIVTARLKRKVQAAALERLLHNHPYTDWRVTGNDAVELVQREQVLNRMSLRRTVKGLRADLEYLDRFNDQHAARLHEEETKLKGLGIRPTVAADLMKWLDEQNLVPGDYPRTAKTGALSGAKGDLAKLNHPVAADFLWHKEQVHVMRDYLEKARNLSVSRDGDDWLHPVINYFGAVTGRMSVGDPPLQQFPEQARGVILADPGDDLTSIDWSQIEPVVVANVAGQTDVLHDYEHEGKKFYSVVEDLTGIEYKRAKAQLLGTLYGQGAALTASKLGVSLEEAAEIKAAIFRPMAKVLNLTHTLRDLGREYQLVPTVSGRIIPVPMGRFNGEYSVATHKAVNYFVQGSAYDVLADSAVQCERAGLGDAIYLLMHDEIVCSTDAAHDIRKIMETPSERLCYHSGRTPILRTDTERLGERWATV